MFLDIKPIHLSPNVDKYRQRVLHNVTFVIKLFFKFLSSKISNQISMPNNDEVLKSSNKSVITVSSFEYS